MGFSPNDFGNFLTLESCEKININDLIRWAKDQVKRQYLELAIEDLGVQVDLVTSKTRFGGKRYWFKCPNCGRRVGVLYRCGNRIGCRSCLGYRYRKSRYKGMVELENFVDQLKRK